MGIVKDRSGQRYGRLVVSKCVGRTQRNDALWECLCDCGNSTVVESHNFKSTRSCGCLKKEGKRSRCGDPEKSFYGRWANMLSRCRNPKATEYAVYGGRGISVCERWHTFSNFHADMWPTFKPELSLDRIDPNGNYCPENCEWATWKQQGLNRRSTLAVSLGYESRSVRDWCACIGADPNAAYNRIKRGMPAEEAISIPVNSRRVRQSMPMDSAV